MRIKMVSGAIKYRLTSRREFANLIKTLKYKRAAEIGVYKGGFSFTLLKNSDLDILYSIDIWSNYDGTTNNDLLEKCQQTLSEFGKRSKIIIKPSVDASLDFKDDSLDFVFIDADHSYEETKKDIEAWIKKVKIGGILAGHDYRNYGRATCREYAKNLSEIKICEVKGAVDEFVLNNNYKLNLALGDGINWWLFKTH